MVNNTSDLTEKDFQRQVNEIADLYGWRRYHTWLARHSPAGFPDNVFVRDGRLIFAELKSDQGKVSPLQEEWLDDLGQCPGVEVYLWRPKNIEAIPGVLA